MVATAVMVGRITAPPVEVIRYEQQLPDEVIDAAIAVIERAQASHQYYLDYRDIAPEMLPHHQKCADSYAVAIYVLENMGANNDN